MNARVTNALLAVSILLTAAACSRDDDQVAQTPEASTPAATDPGAVNAQIWLDDFRLAGSADGSISQTKEQFAPGEPIQVSMRVDDAPQGTNVTTHWYGPDGQPLGYETKQTSPGQERLSFVQDNTLDWTRGEYRAEVWVGDEKVNEQTFEISTG